MTTPTENADLCLLHLFDLLVLENQTVNVRLLLNLNNLNRAPITAEAEHSTGVFPPEVAYAKAHVVVVKV